MKYNLIKQDSADEPLLREEERLERGLPARWKLRRITYLGFKVTFFRCLDKEWMALSANDRRQQQSAEEPHDDAAEDSSVGIKDDASPPRTFQNAFVTVLSLWNAMASAVVVGLPYGFSCSGILLGIGLVLLVGLLCWYTCALIVREDSTDFGRLMGRRLQVAAVALSALVLLSACISFHVLMKHSAHAILFAIFEWRGIDTKWTPSQAALLVCLLFPLTLFKNVAALVRLNACGVIFLLFTVYFIASHGIQAIATHQPMDDVDFGAKASCGVLGGIVTQSFFIHHAIQPMVRSSNPSTRSRDVALAYLLVGLTCVAVGVLGYIGFPKGRIEPNFMDAFPATDVVACAARLSFLLQLAAVYPLFVAVIRTQIFSLTLQNPWPSLSRVLALNVLVMTTTTLFAVFYPDVVDILRLLGAVGGFVLIFGAPIAMQSLSRGRWWPRVLCHAAVVGSGLTLLLRIDVQKRAVFHVMGSTDEDAHPLTALHDDAKAHAIKAVQLSKSGDYHGAIAALDSAIQVDGDNAILWKHLAIAHYELWKRATSATATLASTSFLAKHSNGTTDPLELLLRNAYDVFIVAMEYVENKHDPALLLQLAALYVELGGFQGALSLCTLVLETTRPASFPRFNQAVFLAAVVAHGLRHATQAGKYFAYLLDMPPHSLRSYQLVVLAAMQFDGQTDSNEALQRGRVLYAEAYRRLTCGAFESTSPSEQRAMDAYRTSRKSENERILQWMADANLWESLGAALCRLNYPTLATAVFEYAINRGGCTTKELLVDVGRVCHRLKQSERAQSFLERALQFDYFDFPTRFWLGVASAPWKLHFARENFAAKSFQRVYRGHQGRRRVQFLRHRRACRLLAKVRSVAAIFLHGRSAKTRVAIRKALELEREAAARQAMHDQDAFLVYLKWNAAARKIQSLLPIHRAKVEKHRRRMWMEKHKALLRRVVSNSNARLVQTCFASIVEFVAMLRDDKRSASLVLQRAVRSWLCRRQLDRLRRKRAQQQTLVDTFLGKTAARWKNDCFAAWKRFLAALQAQYNHSAIRIQSAFRAHQARRLFRLKLERQLRVRRFMEALLLHRKSVALRQCFNALATLAIAARLRKLAAATKIQKIVRGRQARVRAAKLRRRRQYCDKMVQRAVAERRKRLVEQLWSSWQLYLQVSALEKQSAATAIQRVFRGRAVRRWLRRRRDYLRVYFGHRPCRENDESAATWTRLLFVAIATSRQFRMERQDVSARVLQRAWRHAKSRRLAKTLRDKLLGQRRAAHVFQTTFHMAAAAFFQQLRRLRLETQLKKHQAARLLQRNLRGWLARRVFKRMAAQHRQAKALLDRVIHRKELYWKRVVLQLWKEWLEEHHEESVAACIRIQRLFRARQAMKLARRQMDKLARQQRLLDQGWAKPLARAFRLWQQAAVDRMSDVFRANVANKYTKSFGEKELPPPPPSIQDVRSTAVPSMLFYHVLTRTRQSGVCHLPVGHGFDLPQLRQLFQLATSVISDAGGVASQVADALAWLGASPVQKLILYNEPTVNLVKLARCLDSSSHCLTSLVLGGAFLSTRHVTALALALAQPTAKLQQLVLDSCHIGNGGAVVLALGLVQNRSVWKFDVSSNHIGDGACRALGEMLLGNETLQIVCLNGNAISDTAALTYLEPAVANLPSASALTSLHLHNNPKLTSRGLTALARAVESVNSKRPTTTTAVLRLEPSSFN
ncbi:unnamed protein product [Aphanomyces euteiches]